MRPSRLNNVEAQRHYPLTHRPCTNGVYLLVGVLIAFSGLAFFYISPFLSS